eukprot:tig00000955_g5779.t1
MDEESSSVAPEKVRVVVRIRPLNPVEAARGDPCVAQADGGRSVQIMQVTDDGYFDGSNATSFKFSAVFGPSVAQEELFDSCGVQRLIMSAVNGYSATVFAFGQTGSGKTYSMSGAEHVILSKNYAGADARDGIIPRSMQFLYQQLQREAEAGGMFKVRMTYLEIYNEQVRDLLNPGGGALGVRWTRNKGFHVDAVNFTECPTVKEAMMAVKKGLQARRVASHELNKDSNRSHCMLTVHVDRQAFDDGRPIVTHGKIAFVDLAGSERLKDSKAENGLETGSINKSLFTLGKVISTLASNERRNSDALVPFRESKLTKLLIDSLGGNSMTLMVVCCSPSVVHANESLRSLQFAARAANIRNRPRVLLDEREQLVVNLRHEIEALRRENGDLRRKLDEIMSLPYPPRMHTAGEAEPPQAAPSFAPSPNSTYKPSSASAAYAPYPYQAYPPAPASSSSYSASPKGRGGASPRGRGRGKPAPRVGGWTQGQEALRTSLEQSYGVPLPGPSQGSSSPLAGRPPLPGPSGVPMGTRGSFGSAPGGFGATGQSWGTAPSPSPSLGDPGVPPASSGSSSGAGGGMSASQRVAAARAREAALMRELDSLVGPGGGAGSGAGGPPLAALPEGPHGLEMEEEEGAAGGEEEGGEGGPASPAARWGGPPRPYPYPSPSAAAANPAAAVRRSNGSSVASSIEAMKERERALGRQLKSLGKGRGDGGSPPASGPSSPSARGAPAAPFAPVPAPVTPAPVLRPGPFPGPAPAAPPAFASPYPPAPHPVAVMPSYFGPQPVYPGAAPPSPLRMASLAGKESKRGARKGKGPAPGQGPRKKSPARGAGGPGPGRPLSFQEQVASLSLVAGPGGLQVLDMRQAPGGQAPASFPAYPPGPAPGGAPGPAPRPPPNPASFRGGPPAPAPAMQPPTTLSVPAFLMGNSPDYLTRHERLIVDLQAARVREQQEMVEMRRKMNAWLQAAGVAPVAPGRG